MNVLHSLSLLMCAVRLIGGQQNAPQNAFQTYQFQQPLSSHRFAYSWSGVQSPELSGFQNDLTRRFPLSDHLYSKSEPVDHQIITITDYSSDGRSQGQLTSRLSKPVNIFEVFQKSFDSQSSTYEQPVLSPGFGQPKVVMKKVVRFGTRFDSKTTPPKAISFGSIGSQDAYNPQVLQTSPPLSSSSKQYGNSYLTPHPSLPPFPASLNQSGGSLNLKNSYPYIEFPSSEDLDVRDNGLEEKHLSERSAPTTLRQSKKFVQAALDAHNGYRKKHKVSLLSYNGQIAKVAQAWANKLIAQGGHLHHRPNNKYGENLWMGSGYKFSDEQAVKHAVKSWYDEITKYKSYFGREPSMSNFGAWGHFTQVVWKSTARVGVAIARKNNIIVVVANYDPPGNARGQFAKNVKKP